MINILTSYAILVPLSSTSNCCLLMSPATPVTETVVGVRRRVTWKFSVEYFQRVLYIPWLKYELAFLTVLCCVTTRNSSTLVLHVIVRFKVLTEINWEKKYQKSTLPHRDKASRSQACKVNAHTRFNCSYVIWWINAGHCAHASVCMSCPSASGKQMHVKI